MKHLTIFILLFTFSLSCTNSIDENNNSETFWECLIDGESYEAVGSLAYAVRFDVDNTIAVYGSEDPLSSGYRNMFISTKDEGLVGNYDLALGGLAVGTLFNSSGDPTFISGLEDGSGNMEITSIDEEFVEGTFEFIGVDPNGNSIEITNGKFKVKFN